VHKKQKKVVRLPQQHIKCPIYGEAMQNGIRGGLRMRRKPQKPTGGGGGGGQIHIAKL